MMVKSKSELYALLKSDLYHETMTHGPKGKLKKELDKNKHIPLSLIFPFDMSYFYIWLASVPLFRCQRVPKPKEVILGLEFRRKYELYSWF
jgi:hypothetical protein